MRLHFPEGTRAQLVDVNPRSEKHGPDELVPAIDLRLEVDAANGALEQLHDALAAMLYTEDPQDVLPGIDAVSDARKLRFPQLGQPLTWNGEATGYRLTVDYGLGGDSNIVLYDCKVHKFKLTAKEGGTCTMTFTVSCAHDLAESDVGKLGTRVQHDVYVGLEPPSLQDEQQDLPLDAPDAPDEAPADDEAPAMAGEPV